MTFSLLPDCLAARLPGTLQGVEEAVAAAEAAPSLAVAVEAVRAGAVLPRGAMRWLVRRVRLVRRSLTAVRGLFPDRFLGCAAEVGAFRVRLQTAAALVHLRELGAEQLPRLPAPLGFSTGTPGAADRSGDFQHKMGADPPVAGG